MLSPMMAVRPSSSRASAGAMSSWPICTPSASAASATSTRSLISSGTPVGSSTSRSARASSTMARVSSHACRATAPASRLPATSARQIGERAAAGDVGIERWRRGADRRPSASPARVLTSVARVEAVERIDDRDGEAAGPVRPLRRRLRRRRRAISSAAAAARKGVGLDRETGARPAPSRRSPWRSLGHQRMAVGDASPGARRR